MLPKILKCYILYKNSAYSQVVALSLLTFIAYPLVTRLPKAILI